MSRYDRCTAALVRHALPVALANLTLLFAVGFGAEKLSVESGIRVLFSRDDFNLLAKLYVEKTFGREDNILVVIDVGAGRFSSAVTKSQRNGSRSSLGRCPTHGASIGDELLLYQREWQRYPHRPSPLARTLDHIAADSIRQTTPYFTLGLSCNDHKNNIESIYFDNMSWYGTGRVAPSMKNLRKVYDRMFGTRSETRFRNITDLAVTNPRRFQRQLSRSDRRKFDEYFEAIRTIEKRMHRIEAMKSQLTAAVIERPAEHLPRNEYIHLMGDLLVTALQIGVTNIGTLMVGFERWTTPTKWEGIVDKPHSHHAMTHNPHDHLEDLLKLDRFHVSAFARLLERMDRIEETGGIKLLDNIIFTLGAGVGDRTTYQYNVCH